MSATWNGAKLAIRRLPGLRTLDQARQRARLMVTEHGNAGVFRSFDEARAWLPKTSGFDAEELADEFLNVRTKKVFAYDYPVMFWLSKIFLSGARNVLDVGGSVGVHYIAYQRLMEYPSDLSWTVAEVPAMVKIGRDLAQGRGLRALRFIDSRELARTEADVWLSAGAIHYIEQQPAEIIAMTAPRPRHLILNKLPLYHGASFVTAQNVQKGSFSPHHVYNRGELIERISALGYELADEWLVHERDFYLAGHPERSFAHYSGLYFKATA